jgi:hypothetical protein
MRSHFRAMNGVPWSDARRWCRHEWRCPSRNCAGRHRIGTHPRTEVLARARVRRPVGRFCASLGRSQGRTLRPISVASMAASAEGRSWCVRPSPVEKAAETVGGGLPFVLSLDGGVLFRMRHAGSCQIPALHHGKVTRVWRSSAPNHTLSLGPATMYQAIPLVLVQTERRSSVDHVGNDCLHQGRVRRLLRSFSSSIRLAPRP